LKYNKNINKTSLTFKDKEIENEFRVQAIKGGKLLIRTALIFGVTIFVFGSLLGASNSGEPPVYWINRGVIIITTVFFLLLTFTKKYENWYLGSLVFVYISGSFSAIYGYALDASFIIFIHLRIIFFTVIPFFTLRLLILSNFTILLGMFLIPFFISNKELATIANHTFQLFPFFVISTLAYYIKQKFERENFLRSKELNEKNKTLEYEQDKLIQQATIIDKAHTKIKSSINYAQRIQSSLLAPSQFALNQFEDLLLTFLPKETVSGDFYFVKKKANRTYVAVADCTGHGVPGSLVSTLGIQELSHIIEAYDLSVSQMLDLLNTRINTLLNNDNQIGSDGMDIILLCIDPDKNNIEYSGAKGIFYLQNEDKIEKQTTDRVSIGQKQQDLDFFFSYNAITYKKGDYLFLMTDGLIDQFSKITSKRIGSKKIKTLLEETLPMNYKTKKEYITSFINTHKTDNQTDDITLISFKL